MELLPTAAGKMSTCSDVVPLVSVRDTVAVVVAADCAASAVRGGEICTSAAVTPSTTAVTASSARTDRRRVRGPACAVRSLTSLREYAATASTAAARPT